MYEYVVCIYKYIVITRYLFYDLYRQIALCNDSPNAMPSFVSSFSLYRVPRSAFGGECKAMRWTTIATMTLGAIVER